MKLIALIAGVLIGGSATYTNPVLHSDYSDPDLICVDGEYWMTSSSFQCVPGLQILHSTDLVNWEIVGAGLPDEVTRLHGPEHGCGVWAPSIRHFNGKYWIFWGDPDKGVYQIHADHPAGQWSAPVRLWSGRGIIDPCPLLDDDGRIYLVHAWAGSRAGFKSVLGVCELDADCTRFVSEQMLVFDGKKSGDDTVEGPKFYKRDGWYYIFAPAGGVKEGWQIVLRSRNVYGPYEYRRVLHQGNTDIHGPHQGGWVEDAAGDSWFMHFEDRYAYGRVCHLQPMEWTSDGWCTMGVDTDGDGIGEPVKTFRRPAPFPEKPGYPRSVPALETRTDFTHEYIPYNWQWHADPVVGWALLNPSEGYLRLNCGYCTDRCRNLWDVGEMLLEKVVGPEMTLDTKLVFRPSYEGDRVGVVMMGMDYSTIEMVYEGGRVSLRRALCLDAESGSSEVFSDGISLGEGKFHAVWIRLNVLRGGMCRFSYSLDGRRYKALGDDFRMKEGRWIGAKTGFFAVSRVRKNDGGSVDIY